MNKDTLNAGYTPGPWHIHDTEQFTICGPDHLAIAITTATSRNADENGRNARLIAAAPELLEACKRIHYELNGANATRRAVDNRYKADPLCDLITSIVKDAAAAIAAAEGRE